MSFFEYLLIISPNEEVKRDVMELKRIYADRYGCKKAVDLIPHITMGNWLQSDYREAQIIANITRLGETVNPFLAQFDGLGHFNPKTIFVNVLNKEPFREISKGLRDSTSSLLNLKKYVTFPSTAHLTIARAMEPEQFERAWSEWKDKEYKASFNVSELILLRRPSSKEEHSKYKAIATIPLRGKGRYTKQLELGF